MRLIIDADASPVKDLCIRLTEEFACDLLIVSSYDHYSHAVHPPHVQEIYVEAGSDAADFKILSLLQEGDILLTQDFGLASLALNRATVIHHRAYQYRKETIDRQLLTRHLNAMERKAGGRTKGPRPFSQDDQKKFETFLRRLLRQKQEEAGRL